MKLRVRKIVAIALLSMTVCNGVTGNFINNTEAYVAQAATSITAPTLTLTKRTSKTATFNIGQRSKGSTYRIYRSSSYYGKYSYVGKTQSGKYKDTGLSSNASYYYKVKAVNSGKESSYSNIVRVGSNLGRPTNVTGVASKTSVTLNWSRVSNASSYEIYRSTSQNGTYTKIATTYTNGFVDNSVAPNSTYYYKVRGIGTIQNVSYKGVFSKVTKVAVSSSTGSGNTGNNSNNTNNQFNSEYAAEVLRLINVERKKEGLSALTTTSALTNAANQRAVEIKSVFSHSRPDGSSCFTALDDYNVSYRTAGENIAYGQKTPEAVVNAWMNSSGHRANIMSSKFGKVGIGCYVGSNGTLYWTQLFTD